MSGHAEVLWERRPSLSWVGGGLLCEKGKKQQFYFICNPLTPPGSTGKSRKPFLWIWIGFTKDEGRRKERSIEWNESFCALDFGEWAHQEARWLHVTSACGLQGHLGTKAMHLGLPLAFSRNVAAARGGGGGKVGDGGEETPGGCCVCKSPQASACPSLPWARTPALEVHPVRNPAGRCYVLPGWEELEINRALRVCLGCPGK